jgi:2-polyprenyl-3-methyl-5-hydroxy-6-metoxy-1,4-benzoquinol methylase
MNLYEDIADFYDEIFPLKEKRLLFVESYIKKTPSNIIDIGCSTGELALALQEKNHRVTGIDLDRKMIEIAKNKAQEKRIENLSTFKSLNMRDIGACFKPGSFNLALCFGNTLTHLHGIMEVKNFLKNVYSILQKKGVLMLQAINFEYIISRGIHELPAIENRLIKFERNYEYNTDRKNQNILFSAVLTIKKSGKVVESCVPLFPLRFETLNELLENCGFSHIQYFENESKKPFSPQSASYIAAAEKK